VMPSMRLPEPFAQRNGAAEMKPLLCLLALHKWEYRPLTLEQELKYFLDHSMVAATEIVCTRCQRKRIVEG
jgi:hypothetical protein